MVPQDQIDIQRAIEAAADRLEKRLASDAASFARSEQPDDKRLVALEHLRLAAGALRRALDETSSG